MVDAKYRIQETGDRIGIRKGKHLRVVVKTTKMTKMRHFVVRFPSILILSGVFEMMRKATLFLFTNSRTFKRTASTNSLIGAHIFVHLFVCLFLLQCLPAFSQIGRFLFYTLCSPNKCTTSVQIRHS